LALSFLLSHILSLAPATDHDKWPNGTDATGQIFKLGRLATWNLIKFRSVSLAGVQIMLIRLYTLLKLMLQFANLGTFKQQVRLTITAENRQIFMILI
jgi:hypothetical protein